MMEHNPLKEKCREILNTKDEILHSRKKIELKNWIRQQTETGLIEMIAELDKNELGMSMNCGLFGKAYTRALSRYVELKDREDGAEEIQSTDKTTVSNDKPVLDKEQGLEQIPPETFISMINKSSDEDLMTALEILYAEGNRRGLLGAPAT